MHLLHSGFVEQGRARLEQAHARARLLGWPNTRLAAFWYEALFAVRLGDAERVAALADEMRTLVDESEVAQGRTACRWFRGWADARMGQPRDGYRRIREAYEDNTRLGMLAGGSEVLGYATEALVLDGDWDGAQRELEDALRVADTLGERVYLPQLFVMQAAIAHARGDRAAADNAIRRAIAEARTQEATWLELMALIELCDRHGATAKDRRALAGLVDRLPEARDTSAVARARALLDKAKPA
jgi:ATP/maltotriose-dependent transcriptional regulator MalT